MLILVSIIKKFTNNYLFKIRQSCINRFIVLRFTDMIVLISPYPYIYLYCKEVKTKINVLEGIQIMSLENCSVNKIMVRIKRNGFPLENSDIVSENSDIVRKFRYCRKIPILVT